MNTETLIYSSYEHYIYSDDDDDSDSIDSYDDDDLNLDANDL